MIQGESKSNITVTIKQPTNVWGCTPIEPPRCSAPTDLYLFVHFLSVLA